MFVLFKLLVCRIHYVNVAMNIELAARQLVPRPYPIPCMHMMEDSHGGAVMQLTLHTLLPKRVATSFRNIHDTIRKEILEGYA